MKAMEPGTGAPYGGAFEIIAYTVWAVGIIS